ncbi:MAG TPA: hypothetical protein ACFYD7_03385 [Candidatus Wujingus californicus]|uniref:hypothetical protein n=1 Tax=Candidatus Wujingus californicus TaxID=3367618 RepID=UPI001DDD48BB|nr:hypothetical protein [Planctomycetota bacterium]MDO8131088.1 hypothetical protein [Candidatus Brocadiales bacterium]
MENKLKGKGGLNIDVKSLSHTSLVEVIKKLKGSNYPELLRLAQKELVERLKLERKGIDNKKIATILVANEYGVAKKKLIAEEWADAIGITRKEFLELIGKR